MKDFLIYILIYALIMINIQNSFNSIALINLKISIFQTIFTKYILWKA
jgi:hypothetical protein